MSTPNPYVEALLVAKSRLAAEGGGSICLALGGPAWTSLKLRSKVMGELAPALTLRSWVYTKYRHDLTEEQVLLCRLAWIDKLIEEYS